MAAAPRFSLAVTGGDPAGIGAEVILKAFCSAAPEPDARWIIIGHLPAFEEAARVCGLPLPRWKVLPPQSALPDGMVFIAAGAGKTVQAGRSDATAGGIAYESLQEAARLAQSGAVQGIATAPVTKASVEAARGRFSGHTEFFAEACGLSPADVVMFFVSEIMRVALLTRHLALSEVSGAADAGLLRKTILSVHAGLRKLFGIERPLLAVLGLNPHAGEGGLFGREEIDVLEPVLRSLPPGVRCEGPFAADGFFTGAHRRFDAVISWYHDQGLIPFKMAARDAGAQLTLGLPWVRTSPDHGSALDIAGRGCAEAGAMRYAMDLALRLVRQSARG